MAILKAAAFLLTLTGIGGIVGAVETGTSPVNAVVVFMAGCIAMAAYIKAEGIPYREKKIYGKEGAEMQSPLANSAEELKELCQPVITYLEKYCDPYTEVHISMDGIKVTSVQCGVPARTKDG